MRNKECPIRRRKPNSVVDVIELWLLQNSIIVGRNKDIVRSVSVVSLSPSNGNIVSSVGATTREASTLFDPIQVVGRRHFIRSVWMDGKQQMVEYRYECRFASTV